MEKQKQIKENCKREKENKTERVKAKEARGASKHTVNEERER